MELPAVDSSHCGRRVTVEWRPKWICREVGEAFSKWCDQEFAAARWAERAPKATPQCPRVFSPLLTSRARKQAVVRLPPPSAPSRSRFVKKCMALARNEGRARGWFNTARRGG